jgi:hypothetical protein
MLEPGSPTRLSRRVVYYLRTRPGLNNPVAMHDGDVALEEVE